MQDSWDNYMLDTMNEEFEKSTDALSTFKKSGKCVTVSLLDDTEYKVDLDPKSKGEEIIKQVNTHLNLEEPEFFGLLFVGADEINYWLDPKKYVCKQLKDPISTKLQFRVMFYTPDPNSLSEYTRYLFTLQIRRDLLDGRLVCSEDTGALLASYIVQGELGNYDPTKVSDGYLKGFNFVPKQTPDIEQKIVDYHKSHRGKGPAESDHQMLDIARKLDMYGLTIYPGQTSDGIDVGLAIFHSGVTVFEGQQRTISYAWECLRKISFKKKKVLLKLRETLEKSGEVVVYSLKNRNAAKNFWKISVNHHVFFRQQTAQPTKPGNKQGSKYVYTGRTKKEIEIAEQARRLSEQQMLQITIDSSSTNDQQKLMSNGISTMQSDDGGSYSIQSECSFQAEVKVQENGVSDSIHNGYTPSSTSNLEEKKPAKISLMDKLKMTEGEVLTQADSVPYLEHELKDGTDLSGSFKTEVASMFQKINSEYGATQNGWLDIENKDEEGKDESSDTEDSMQPSSEFTEVDGNQIREDFMEKPISLDETEPEDNSELQLKQKVIELYMPPQNSAISYDSDSDASAMTVDEEESAFEDDMSLTPSSCSSISSFQGKDGYVNQVQKFKWFGYIYNIAKEMQLTERTLVKDLEVITVSFRNTIEKENVVSDDLMRLLYDNLDPLYDYHCSLLAELDERLSLWEMSSEAMQDNSHKIGDILHRNMRQIKLNIQYIKKHEDIMLALESMSKTSSKFDKVYKEFELGSVCYLSLNSFLMKPVQRLLYYRTILEHLTKEYDTQRPDSIDAKVAYKEVIEACKEVEPCRDSLSNLHKLVELQRDLVCIRDLVHPKRRFIREGCLHKICRKGPQPRMFFLLSDILLYTSQGVTATNQFRARASIPLKAMKIEEGGVELHSLYAFTIVCPDGKSFTVAASSPDEKSKWMDDIHKAIQNAVKESFCSKCEANKTEFILNIGTNTSYMCPACKEEIMKLENMCPEERLQHWQKKYPPPVSINQLSSEADSDDEGSYSLNEQYSTLNKRHAHARTMSTRKVCWHRNASISMNEYIVSIENSLSGNLRRKCKNTNRWQKMWVVFTNFSLFFFKNCDEDSPFASLPLIGYVVSKPSDCEVHDGFAIKLQFKTHIYIFKADKEYDFKRWMEVLKISTESCSKQARLKTRMNSRIKSTT